MRGAWVFFWEQWRQTYKGLLLVLAMLLAFAAVVWQFRELVEYIFAKNLTLVVGAAHVPALGAMVLLFIQENRGRIGFAYPRRMLVLPAHTAVLVAAPFVYRIVVVGAFALLTGFVCDLFVRDAYFVWPQVWLLTTATAAAHALVFLTCGYGAATGTAIFVAALLATTPGLHYFLGAMQAHLSLPSPLPDDYRVPDIGYGGAPIAALVLGFWFVAAYIGARHARSEVPEDPVGGLVRVATRITYFDRERGQFNSPEDAQRWLEWRRGAYLFPWISLVVGIVLTLTLQSAADQMENRFVLSFYLLAVAPAVVASLVGYIVTRSGNDYQWFVGARPLTTAAIARAKLRAGVRAVFWAYVLLLAVFLVTFKWRFPNDPILPSLVSDLRVITSTQGPYSEGLALFAIVGITTVLAVWTLFWLARASGVFVMLAGVIVALWSAWAGGIYVVDMDTGEFTTPEQVFIIPFSILMGVAGAIAMLVAVYRGYISPLKFAGVVVLWFVLLGLAIYADRVAQFDQPLYIMAAWLFLPAVPLASVPLALEWQRHR